MDMCGQVKNRSRLCSSTGPIKVATASHWNCETMISDALHQHCYSTRVLDNILKYKRENLALQNVSVLEDLSEAEGQEIPEELSDCELAHSAENCNGQKAPRGSIAFKKL